MSRGFMGDIFAACPKLAHKDFAVVHVLRAA